jgi:hypothetical protein
MRIYTTMQATYNYYGTKVGGVNICPGQPYFLVPQEDMLSRATIATRGNTRTIFENICIPYKID